MSFRREVANAYKAHGAKHLLPFIGSSYDSADPKSFRVAIVGIKAYEGDDQPTDEERRRWVLEQWQNAGTEQDSYRFHQQAFKEADELAQALATSAHFPDVVYDPSPQKKTGYYATNAVKEFLSEDYKDTGSLTPELVRRYEPTWHKELDIMAKHGVLPHLIISLGEIMWETMWCAFAPNKDDPRFEPIFKKDPSTIPTYRHLKVTEYTNCGKFGGSAFDHANRIKAETAVGAQTVVLARLHHPHARTQPRRGAAWLLARKSFRNLVSL